MLTLKTESPQRWLVQVRENLPEILIDHAHCEKKAAACAMNLIQAYVDNYELCREMTEIVNEELEHFQRVLELLRRRGIRFRRMTASSYGRRLNELVRKDEPNRAIDRLLVAGLIEARSCERFDLLRKHVNDEELADFYHELFESEARHYTSYVRMAKMYGSESAVMKRLHDLADQESEIIASGDPMPRMHS
jgi:tRNA-(ms[2]io[6]A)-hydroxylase